jgi:hypothetical protein
MAHKKYTVRQGDCISSIAYEYGFFPSTIWDDPKNAALKETRKDPNVLFAGDVIYVPEKQQKEESCGGEQRHRFKRRGVPSKFRIKLMIDDEPRANVPYRVVINGVTSQGTTDGDGLVEGPLPPIARQGTLYVGDPGQEDVYELAFGTLDPVDTEEGVKQRLLNLGYAAGQDLQEALRDFQTVEQLSVTGEINTETCERLQQKAGE